MCNVNGICPTVALNKEYSTVTAPPFDDELARWGPESSHSVPSLGDAQSYCRRLATSHYENFPIVNVLLPRRLHQHFFNVYAYCRWADDLGDEVHDAERSLALLSWWRDQLEACYAGQTRHPVFVALAETIRSFEIPQTPFADLISAFEQDQRITEYDTFDQLRDYCRRSADPVGRLVLYLCEQHTPEMVAWSDSICTGLQLANFWQDVARDADIGRVYLPREDRLRFGYSDADLTARLTTPQFIELMRFEVDRARELLLLGEPIVSHMPGRLQVNIDLFLRGGLCILERIEQIDYRVWETRPVVSKTDLAKLFTRSLLRRCGF